jgi:hypothetical protein
VHAVLSDSSSNDELDEQPQHAPARPAHKLFKPPSVRSPAGPCAHLCSLPGRPPSAPRLRHICVRFSAVVAPLRRRRTLRVLFRCTTTAHCPNAASLARGRRCGS